MVVTDFVTIVTDKVNVTAVNQCYGSVTIIRNTRNRIYCFAVENDFGVASLIDFHILGESSRSLMSASQKLAPEYR